MEDLIEKIIEIEEHAQEVISDARQAEQEIDKRVTLDGIRMENDIVDKTKAKDEKLKQDEDDRAKKEIDRINENTKNALDALNAKYEANKDSWIDVVVNSVIGE